MNDDLWMTKVSVLQASTCCCSCCFCLALVLLPLLTYCFNHRYHHYCFCPSVWIHLLLDSSSNFKRRSKNRRFERSRSRSGKIAFKLAMRASVMQMNRPRANWTAASLCLALDFLLTGYLLRATTKLTKTLMLHFSTFAYTFNFTQPTGHLKAEFRYLMLLLLYNQRTRDGPVFDHHFVTIQRQQQCQS